MKLGIIGRGYWGDTYARTLHKMGVEHWQLTHTWSLKRADGIIIATPGHTHYSIAADCITKGIPVLIEKPLCMNSRHALELLRLAEQDKSIVFTGHTRLYSPLWRDFKSSVGRVDTVFMQAGGPTKLGWLWDWGPHLVSMCLDLGFDPLRAHFIEMPIPPSVTVNGNLHYVESAESPTPLEVLLSEFIAAIQKGDQDIAGLRLGVKVVQALEKIEESMEAAVGVE